MSTLAPAAPVAVASPATASSDLIAKYNVPGPRYTSYPTVPFWETNPTQEE